MLMATITKKDPADRIAERSGASHVLTRRIVQELLDEIVAGLIKGNRSEFRDFGVFETKMRAARSMSWSRCFYSCCTTGWWWLGRSIETKKPAASGQSLARLLLRGHSIRA
jgi:hypothetical protein